MDTLQHAAWGFAISLQGNQPVETCIAGAVVGAAPDVIGWAEKVLRRDENSWGWYNAVHSVEATGLVSLAGLAGLLAYSWWWALYCAGAWVLHVALDSQTHAPGKRWWVANERLSWEVLGWVIVAAYLLYRLLTAAHT